MIWRQLYTTSASVSLSSKSCYTIQDSGAPSGWQHLAKTQHAGDDQATKDTVAGIASDWGWASVNDMGGIDQSWLLEGFALMWIHYDFLNNHWTHGFKLLSE